MNKTEQYKFFNDFLSKLTDGEIQYHWSDIIKPFIDKNKLSEREAFQWWRHHQARRWPDTYKLENEAIMEKKFGTKEEWIAAAKQILANTEATESELKSAIIGVRSFSPELAAKLQKRIDDKDFISAARLKTQYKKKLKGLKEYLQKELMCEKLVLKRKDNMIYVVPDDAKSRNEPFRNKEKLKKVGFEFDRVVNSWGISTDKFRDAQEIVAKINKEPLEKFLDDVKNLPEFIQDADDFSKKTELSRKTESFINDLSKEVDDVKASALFRNYMAFSSRLRGLGVKGPTNLMLVYVQNPNATYVMSKTQWEKAHRRIKKESFGKKAIWLYVKKGGYKQPDASDDSGLEQDIKRRNTGYWTVYQAYDIADTEAIDARGEMPEEPNWFGDDTPEEKADKLAEYALEFASENAITVSREAPKGGEKGWALGDHMNINKDIAGSGGLSTIIHEMAHSLMHFKESSPFFVKRDKPLGKEEKELQAETVAYVVLRHFDMPCKSQSTYLANWRASGESLQKNISEIKAVADYITQGIDRIAKEKSSEPVKEMISKGNVGITEMTKFYSVASPIEIKLVEKLLDNGYEKQAWRVITKVLKNKGKLDEINWKSAVAGALVGAAALSPFAAQGASHKHAKASVTHAVKSSVSINDSIETILKYFENNHNNPKGGFNKSKGKWYPHESIEGGSDTIAYGHKIVGGEDFSDGLTETEATKLLKTDIAKKESLAKRKFQNYTNFPQYVKNAIINALYRGDMGPKTSALINSGQWDKVSSEYLDHRNYKSGKYPQIKERMKMNADAFDKYAKELKK